MNLAEFKAVLASAPQAAVRFQLPDGSSLAAHAHVTEVARFEKHFIDCGGTERTDAFCRLQTWVADDVDHRLSAGKLLGILDKAAPILKRDDLTVDVELEVGFVTQMPLESAAVESGELRLRLAARHTDCLAREKCCPPTPTAPAAPQGISFRNPFKKP